MRHRLLILVNHDKPRAMQAVEDLRGWLSDRAEIVAVLPTAGRLSDDVSDADLCLVFGGDGTLLSAARMLAARPMPVIGVNMGKLGFLAEYSVDDLKEHLDSVLAGEVKPHERLMLSVSVAGQGSDVFQSPVANEVAIAAGPPFRMIDLAVAQGGTTIAQYLGDGLIVATATGSTGYNVSVGGPVMAPTIKAIAITPVAPHSFSMRPIVLDAVSPIEITVTHANDGTAMIVDGQLCCPLGTGNQVLVAPAANCMKIVPHPTRPFFCTLAGKLQWGQSPHHTY